MRNNILYRGKSLEDCTKEELIECIDIMKEYENYLESHIDLNNSFLKGRVVDPVSKEFIENMWEVHQTVRKLQTFYFMKL